MSTRALVTLVVLAAVVSLGFSPPVAAEAEVSFWKHKGSVMRLERHDDGRVVITYDQPRDVLLGVIDPGQLAAELKPGDSGLIGTALSFKRGCDPAPYDVKGVFTGTARNRLVLTGEVPRQRGCVVTGYTRNRSGARMVFTRIEDESTDDTVKTDSPDGDGVLCHLAIRPRDGWDSIVHVETDKSGSEVEVGQDVTIRWRYRPDVSPKCMTPLYLVISTSRKVRFRGEGFLAMPPGAQGPFDIGHRIADTRVFVPLHLDRKLHKGELQIRTFEAGQNDLHWALVEVPARHGRPVVRDDLMIGHERTVPGGYRAGDMNVVAGAPRIVVRDRFTTDKPVKTVRSNSREFDLQIFNEFYRVVSVQTGELVLERAGKEPNFSPSSRYLGAYAEGSDFELLDLYSGEVVTSSTQMQQLHDVTGYVEIAAWGRGDTIVALGNTPFGGIYMQQALVDGASRAFDYTTCKVCSGVFTPLMVDIDAGLVAKSSYSSSVVDQWISLFDVSNKGGKPWESEDTPAAVYTSGEAPIYHRLNELSAVAKTAAAKTKRVNEQRLSDDRRDGPYTVWRLSGPANISHGCSSDWCPHPDVRNRKVVHQTLTTVDLETDKDDNLSGADTRLVRTRLANDTRVASEDDQPQARPAGFIFDRLSQLGLEIRTAKPIPGRNDKGEPLKKWDERDLDKEITSTIRRSASLIRSKEEAEAYRKSVKFICYDEDELEGKRARKVLLNTQGFDPLAYWEAAGQNGWLITTGCWNGAGSRTSLLMMIGSPKKRAKLIDVSFRLRFKVGSRPSGLDDEGKLEIHGAVSGTLGYGGWPQSVDRFAVVSDRYLLATGLWPGGRWGLVFDVETEEIVSFVRNLTDAANFAVLGLTEDGRTLVQANTNGRLFFYDVATGETVLEGVEADDELIVYDPNGYYTASPEGGQFLNLKFPGVPGYVAVRQFASALDRPDLIKAILAGKRDVPNPGLTTPPDLQISTEMKAQGDGRAVVLRYSAGSQTGLRELVVYVDGRPVRNVPLSGTAATAEVAIPLSPEARWISAVAIDRSGYESIARGSELTGARPAVGSRLFVISVGTNVYDNFPDRQQLSSARQDAEAFAASMEKLGRDVYASVEVVTFLDEPGLQTTLIEKLRSVAARAGEGDTIMLFAAGHGTRDEKSGQFHLITRSTDPQNFAETSVSWADIAAAFGTTKSRIIAFLDACQSGAAGSNGTNDDVVSELLNNETAITVLAAAKGRQVSWENLPDIGPGGVFTTTIVKAITSERNATDTNGNGAVELAELYGRIKRQVVKATLGEQTPWIARNRMVGEVPLF